MKITLTTERGNIFPLDVSLELTLGDLRALVEMEVEGLGNPQSVLLLHNMQPMQDMDKALSEYGIQEDDVIVILEQAEHGAPPPPVRSQPPQSVLQGQPLPPINWGDIAVPSATSTQAQAPVNPDDPDVVRRQLRSNPYALSTLQQRNPPLHQAAINEDPRVFREAYQQHVQRVRDVERDRIRMINADPFDVDAQTRIAQEIEQKNIEENMTAAIEYTPESFSRVVMLYVGIKVNGVHVKALVDSGARATIMSEHCAERCNVMRLVDKRFAGVAYGVGTQTIIGKVHLGQIQLGNDFLTSSFQVLKDQSEDMLLGLDMLRRHQVCLLNFIVKFCIVVILKLIMCFFIVLKPTVRISTINNLFRVCMISQVYCPTHLIAHSEMKVPPGSYCLKYFA